MNEIKLEKRTQGEREAYLEGFEAGKRMGYCSAARTSGWISCKERLPEVYEEILMCDEQGNIFTGDYSGGKHPFEDNYGYYRDDVIAWMPLPEPYKERTE